MKPERLRFLESIVQVALDREADARASFLDSVCGGDAALRADIDALLGAHEEAKDEFLSIPALAWSDLGSQALRGRSGAPGPPPGESIGPYRILSVLGEGGMGTVYLAQQSAPIRRRVAIKLIRSDPVDREVVRRFKAERQALARMSHPNIAQVLEAGSTVDGRHYFVMEFVPGLPITEYCDVHRLDLSDRMRLLRAVCAGVQHAHEKGILHRDLKPSNVLVTEVGDQPVPKIIDFGIAKAMDRPITQESLHTGRHLIGTPAYWSPEALQIREWGTDVDTRSDVYSLGALLYELLVGLLPIDIRNDSLLRAIQRILTEPPVAPSARLASLERETRDDLARRRRSDAAALAGRLRGDLDWITLKALAKERANRYDSPAALAAELTRHLEDEPVLASPPSALYRMTKFLRRHRAGVVSAALMVIALIGAVVGTTVSAGRATREAERANREADVAREVSEFLVELFQVSDPRGARGGDLTAAEILERGATRIRDEMVDQPLTQARLMETIGSVYRNLGILESAADLVEQAHEIRERELGDDPLDLAAVQHQLALIYFEQGRLREADTLFQRALATREELLGPESLEVAKGLNNLATIAGVRGRYAESADLHRRVLAIKEETLGAGHPSIGRSLINLGMVYTGQGRLEEAETVTRRGVAILEAALGPVHPDVLLGLNNLAVIYVDQRRYAEGESLHRQVLSSQERVLGERHFQVARSLHNLAELSQLQKRDDEAESLYRRALELAESSLGEGHELVAHPLSGLATLYRDQQRYAEAEPLFARALAIRERTLEATHPYLDTTLREYAALLDIVGRAAEADALRARVRSQSD